MSSSDPSAPFRPPQPLPTAAIQSAVPVPPPLEPPVQFERIAEAAFDDPERMRQIMEMLLREIPRELAALMAAVGSRNLERVAQVAHKTCGACGQSGLVAVVAPLQRIEALAKSGGQAGLAEQVKVAAREFERCRVALAERVRELERASRS